MSHLAWIPTTVPNGCNFNLFRNFWKIAPIIRIKFQGNMRGFWTY